MAHITESFSSRPFCIALSRQWGPFEESLATAADVGWQGFFVCWRQGDDLRPLAA